MKYTILKDTVAGGNKVYAGDVIDLPEDEGKVLMSYGKAEKAKASAPKKEDRSVGLDDSEKPKVQKRKSK